MGALADRLRTKKGRLVTNCLFRQGVFVNALALCASDASLNPIKRVQEHDIPDYTNIRPHRSPSHEMYESSDRQYFALVASPHHADPASDELAEALGCANSTEAVGAALSNMPFADIESLMEKLSIPLVVKTDASISPVYDPRLQTLFESFARDTAPPPDCPKVLTSSFVVHVMWVRVYFGGSLKRGMVLIPCESLNDQMCRTSLLG